MPPLLCLWRISWIYYLLAVYGVGFTNGADASFSSVLEKLSNDVLGVSKYQTYLDKKISSSTSSSLNASGLVASIASDIENNIRSHIEALRKFNVAVLNDLKLPAPLTEKPVPQCCHLNGTSTDARFRNTVDTERYCRITEKWPSSQYFAVNTLPTLQENLRTTPMIKWQYFGGRDGSFFVYPAVDRCTDTIYDPRLKSWYYATAGGKPKDIMILIDTSNTMAYTYGSSGITKLKVSIDAATKIVGTLTPNDRVGVIAFDESITYPKADVCYRNSLALATPQNKQTLAQFLDKVIPETKKAHYRPALQEAFRVLSATHSSQPRDDRERVILLLTDGRSNADREDVYCTVREGNAQLNNSVVVMTFGIDPSMTEEQKSFLKAIAEQNFQANCNISSQTQELTKVGIFTHLDESSTEHVLSKIGFYYDAFAEPNSVEPTFSVPYNDILGLGLVTSACLPVISATQVLGVTCVDIALDLAFHDIINFKLGQLSYAYLIDGHGRTLLHPAVPQPETYDSDPVFIDISSLETAAGSDVIKRNMMSGGSGTMRLNADLVKNRGSSQLEGVDGINEFADYYWNPILVMNISVCLVIVEGETKRQRNWGETSYPSAYLAEHVDIYNRADPYLCKQWGKAASVVGSMVKLAPKSFVEPFNYSLVENKETPETKLLQNYLEGRSNSSGNLTIQAGVRETVALTYALDDIWKNTADESHWTYTLFRYIGTVEGLFRKFPATLMAKEYDPTRRPWYSTAVGAGQIGKITISRPYLDTSGVILLTLCQTVYEGSKSGHSESDSVFGVMGLDITLSSFYKLLVTEFQPCLPENNKRCFIIDRSGFIIVHKDYISSGPPSSAQHITSIEPIVAYDLKEQSIMENDSCADYADITMQSFWKVHTTQVRDLSSCTIYPVAGSNIFIIAPKDSSGVTNSCQCYKKYENGECLKNQVCQCPCYFSVQFDQCSGILQATSTKPCLPPTQPLHVTDVNTELRLQGTKLPDCRPCDVPHLFTNEKLCLETAKCCWNEANSTCQSFCSTERRLNALVIALPVALGVAAFVIVILLVVFFCWRMNNSTKKTVFGFFPSLRSLEKHPVIEEYSSDQHEANSMEGSTSDLTNGSPNVTSSRQGVINPACEFYSSIKSSASQNDTHPRATTPTDERTDSSPTRSRGYRRSCTPPSNEPSAISMQHNFDNFSKNTASNILECRHMPTGQTSTNTFHTIDRHNNQSECNHDLPGEARDSDVDRPCEPKLVDKGYIRAPDPRTQGPAENSTLDGNVTHNENSRNHPITKVAPTVRVTDTTDENCSNFNTSPKVFLEDSPEQGVVENNATCPNQSSSQVNSYQATRRGYTKLLFAQGSEEENSCRDSQNHATVSPVHRECIPTAHDNETLNDRSTLTHHNTNIQQVVNQVHNDIQPNRPGRNQMQQPGRNVIQNQCSTAVPSLDGHEVQTDGINLTLPCHESSENQTFNEMDVTSGTTADVAQNGDLPVPFGSAQDNRSSFLSSDHYVDQTRSIDPENRDRSLPLSENSIYV